MTDDTLREAESFLVRDGIFGAFVEESGELLLVVEADSIDDARTHVNAVAPLLGVKRGVDLVVEKLDEMPAGIPTFLKAFFEAGKIGINRGNVAPGTSTLQ
ncbi:hypothetical protein LP414_09460 [Polaromonas sp. P1(28)-13]|nr:hypothetical protein LP414_09460 [Polaromonas sp. P1(28)-13]